MLPPSGALTVSVFGTLKVKASPAELGVVEVKLPAPAVLLDKAPEPLTLTTTLPEASSKAKVPSKAVLSRAGLVSRPA